MNASMTDTFVQSHPEIDVINIFIPDESDLSKPDDAIKSDSIKSDSGKSDSIKFNADRSLSSLSEETGVLYLRIVMGKPIGKVRSFLYSKCLKNGRPKPD